jgi:hypothetical protein
VGRCRRRGAGALEPEGSAFHVALDVGPGSFYNDTEIQRESSNCTSEHYLFCGSQVLFAQPLGFRFRDQALPQQIIA